jgi:hypothetical protein
VFYLNNSVAEDKNHSRDTFEVTFEKLGLMTLDFSVLYRNVIKVHIQLDRLIGGRTVLIRCTVHTDPKMNVIKQLH